MNLPIRGSQINLAHPLARGLTNAWIFSESQGDSVHDSLIKNAIGNVGTFVNSPTWVGGPNGAGLEFKSADSDRVVFGTSLLIPDNYPQAKLGEITIAVDVTVNSQTVGDARIVTKQLNNGSNDHDWMLSMTGTKAMRFRLRLNGSVVTLAGANNRVVFGKRTMWFCTYNRRYMRLLKDGVLDSEVQHIDKSIDQRTTTYLSFGMGRLGGSGWGAGFDGIIHGVYLFNRDITSSNDVSGAQTTGFAAKSFAANPYQIFDHGISPGVLGELIVAPPVTGIDKIFNKDFNNAFQPDFN